MGARTYLCGDCGATTTTDDDLATCSGCDGILFDDEVVQAMAPAPAPQPRPAAPAPSPRSLRFVVDGRDYVAGDDRAYDVLVHGRCIGSVEPGWGIEGGRVWDFSGSDRRGSGRTRAAAVADAWARELVAR